MLYDVSCECCVLDPSVKVPVLYLYLLGERRADDAAGCAGWVSCRVSVCRELLGGVQVSK